MEASESRRMALRGLHHLTAICQDLERTKAFYRDVLGLRVVGEGENPDDPDARSAWFSFDGGERGTLVSFLEYRDIAPGAIGAGSTHHFAFLVDTAEEQEVWLAYLRDRGVSCSEILERDGFHSLYMRDPDGHIVEIATRGWRFE